MATRVGGIPEIADLRHHDLVPPGDSQALAQAVEHRLTAAIDDSPLRFVPTTWEASASQLCEVIEECRRAVCEQTFAGSTRGELVPCP